MQAHDSAGGIGSALGSLAGKAVVAAQETSGAIKHKVSAAAAFQVVCIMHTHTGCNTRHCHQYNHCVVATASVDTRL